VEKGLDKVLNIVHSGNMAKYDGMRKLERNRMLYEYVDSHPGASMKEVGTIFGITVSRVSKLLKKRREYYSNLYIGMYPPPPGEEA